MAVQRNDPYSAQNFLVDLGDGETGSALAGFAEVSGLETWIEIVEYRNGNDRDLAPAKLPGLNKTGDVTLKRGITGSLNLYKWFDQVRNGDTIALRTVTVTLMSEERTPVMTWKLLRARPVKYSVGPFNAKGTDVAIEEFVLAYERLEVE